MAEAVTQSRRGSAKEYHERITQLIEGTQVSATDAAKTVAQELGKTENSILTAYYRHARKLKGDTGTSSKRDGARRRSVKTVDGYLAEAKAAFEGALKQVGADIDQAQAELDRIKAKHSKDLTALKDRQAKELSAAKTRLENAKSTVKAEKAKLEEKIKLLSA
jgi:hypothetical protein